MPSSKPDVRKSSGTAARRRARVVSSVTLHDRFPTPQELGELIAAVGWTRFTNLEALPASIAGSLFWVVAEQAGRVVGMGRLVGDGARFVYVQDLMVLPGSQRRGIGSAILDRLLDYVNRHLPRKVHVHLFTDRQTAGFYRRYGFKGAETSFYGMSVKKFDKPLGRAISISDAAPSASRAGRARRGA